MQQSLTLLPLHFVYNMYDSLASKIMKVFCNVRPENSALANATVQMLI